MWEENYRRDFNPKEKLPQLSPEVKFWFPIAEPGQVNFEARIRPERIQIPEQVIDKLKSYVRDVLKKISGYSKPELDGIVIGLSGGIDSATTAVLCRDALSGTRYFVKGLIMVELPKGSKEI